MISSFSAIGTIMLISMLLAPNVAFSHVVTSWDWELIDNLPKTKIIYCILPVDSAEGLPKEPPKKWKDIVDQAAKAWNDANTGWTFEPTNKGKADEGKSAAGCQLAIQIKDTNEAGGARTVPATFRNPDKVKFAYTQIDPSPLDQGGKATSWGSTGNTLDPVLVVMHEMGHALRLDHISENTGTKDVTSPHAPGEHGIPLSPKDIEEAKTSVDRTKSPYKEDKKQVDRGGKNCGVDFPVIDSEGAPLGHNLEMNILADALEHNYTFVCRALYRDTVPFSSNVPFGTSNVAIGFEITSEISSLLTPATVVISYTDQMLKNADLYGFDIINESTLRAYSFSGDPSCCGEWELVPGTQTVDAGNNTVKFQTTNLGIFGIAAEASISGTEKISLSNLQTVDQSGSRITSLSTGQQVVLQTGVKNNAVYEQKFAYIVQVKDSDNFTTMIAWINGEIPRQKAFDVGLSWIPDNSGNYIVEVFVWESLTNPVALSFKPITMTITVTR